MHFTDSERAANLAALKGFLNRRRPPEDIRPMLDIGYALVGQTVDLFEIRPDWQDNSATRHTPVARIRYIRSKVPWRLAWLRSDLKWHAYEPSPEHESLQDALAGVDEDAHCCFFG